MFVALLYLFLSPAHALAIDYKSHDVPTVGWVSDPSNRGTFSLITSCVLTLGLCVWSAMHLNIPAHDETRMRFWAKHIKWAVIGVVAPELVVFAAWRQYNSAAKLRDDVNEYFIAKGLLRKEVEHIGHAAKNMMSATTNIMETTPRWTMVHSYYAGMGGFIFELDSNDHDVPFFHGMQRVTLSARGVALLAECGRLPHVELDDIVDKSKADGVAKFLVCLQAMWMVVQVLARAGVHLPVTLLEVNTIGHVLCALFIYILWWHKPRLVHEPTRLEGDWVKALCAYFYMSSQISGVETIDAGLLERSYKIPELSSLAYFIQHAQQVPKTQQSPADAIDNLQPIGSATESTISRLSTSPTDAVPESSHTFSPGHFGIRPELSNQNDTEKGILHTSFSSTGQTPEDASMRATRWRLAIEAMHLYPVIWKRFVAQAELAKQSQGQEVNPSHWLVPSHEELVVGFAPNWPGDDLLRGTPGLIMGMVLWFASMAYGAVHVAAWDEYFPSETEAWLWRSSGVYITFSGALWLLINFLAHEFRVINDYWERILAWKASWLSYAIIGTLCTVCGIAYAFARIFLVVEAFISIRQLPVGAYNTPDWTQLVPHL